MYDSDKTYRYAYRTARTLLSGCPDTFTRASFEDLAQEVAVETWRREPMIRDASRLRAFVRTISLRMRSRSRERARWKDWETMTDDRVADATPSEGTRIEGEWHDRADVLRALDAELEQIGTLNALLVIGFYEGFTCRELAERYELDEDVVKVRLYRSRQRIRRGIVRRMRDGER